MKRKKIDPIEKVVNFLNELIPELSCKKSNVNNQFRFHFNDDDNQPSLNEFGRFTLKMTSLFKNAGFNDELIKKFINAARCTGYIRVRKNSNVKIRDYIIDGKDPIIQALSSFTEKSEWDFAKNACAGAFIEKLPFEMGAYLGLFLFNERKILACVNKPAYLYANKIEKILTNENVEKKEENSLKVQLS